MNPSLLQGLRCLILDVDGVCTDGKLIYGPDGSIATMTFHAQDGAGIKLMLEEGYQVAVISGNRSPIIEHRMRYLGIQHIFLGQEEKLPAFYQLLDTLGLMPEHCAYNRSQTTSPKKQGEKGRCVK
jgi:3-deoxy-D-manno-octulosonate 8-phosphate phosphatase (KDO 8-P phosphatase)